MADFDPKQVKGNDRYIAVGGLVVLVSSVLPWYGASVGGGLYNVSASVKGWGAGATAVIGILLCLAAGTAAVLRATGQLPKLSQVGPAVLLLGLAGLGAVFIVLRWLTLPSGGGGGYSYGARYGLYLGLVGAVVEVVFAWLSFKESGEKLPGLPGD